MATAAPDGPPPVDAGDPDGLLRCADAAMFEVKRSRRALLAELRD